MDGAQNGMAPPAWSFTVEPDELFKPHVKRLDIPHTSSVNVRNPFNFLALKKKASRSYCKTANISVQETLANLASEASR